MENKAAKVGKSSASPSWLVIWGVWLSRIIVGGAFIFSGFSKAVDPWGTIFKLEQYLAVWDFSQPRSLLLAAAIFLCALEFGLGCALLLGIYRRSAPRITFFLMLFFLTLTLYIALKSPVEDCGCFGDALKLSNWATFFKNAVLTCLAIVLIVYNTRISGLVNHTIQWIEGVAAIAYIVTVAMVSYMAQPLIDFRPYAEGTDLIATAETTEVRFLYEKGDETKVFPADSLPSTNSGWVYKSRLQGEGASTTKTIYIEDSEGDDVSEDIIPEDGDLVMLVIPESDRWDVASTMYINRIYDAARKEGVEMIGVIGSASPSTLDLWKDLSMARYPLYSGDDSQLKELSRGEMSLVYIKDGVITEKLSLSVISNGSMQALEKGKITIEELLDFDQLKALKWFTRIYLLVIVVLVVASLPERFLNRIRKKKADS